MRAAMVADVLLTGRERHLASKLSHNAIPGCGGEVKLVQSGHHPVPEQTTPGHTGRTINLFLANATQAANMALARLAIDPNCLNQNGVPVQRALPPGSLLPFRKHGVVVTDRVFPGLAGGTKSGRKAAIGRRPTSRAEA